jgi:hypothetical protein
MGARCRLTWVATGGMIDVRSNDDILATYAKRQLHMWSE